MTSRTNSCFSSTPNASNSESNFAVAVLMPGTYPPTAKLSVAKFIGERSVPQILIVGAHDERPVVNCSNKSSPPKISYGSDQITRAGAVVERHFDHR